MLVDLGADPYTIDKVIAGFGMPMGPFRRAPALLKAFGLSPRKSLHTQS